MNNPSYKFKTIFISYNDSANDLIRAALFSRACEIAFIKFLVLINNSKIKKNILNKLQLNFISLSKLFYIFNFFDGWYLLKKNSLLSIPKKKQEVFFKAFVLTSRNRKASLSNINSYETIFYRILFYLKLNIFVSIFYRKILLNNISQIICEERSKLPEIIFYYLAIQNNIDYIQFTNGNLRSSLVFKRLGTRNAFDHPLSISDFLEKSNAIFPLYKEKLKSVIPMFRNRYKLNNWYDRNIITGSVENKSIFPIFNFKKKEFVVVIFPHIFWDATFAYGKDIFDDYKDWFESTCIFLSRIPNLKILVRPHPDLEWKKKLISTKSFNHMKYFELFVEEINKTSKSEFFLLPSNSNIDALSLIKIANCVLTVRGTIGLEAACFGVPVLTGGSGRYSNLGFTIDSSNKTDYYKNLRNIKYLNKLSYDKVKKAKLLAYFLFKLKPITFFSIDTYRFSSANLEDEILLKIKKSKQLERDIIDSKLHFFLMSEELDLLNKYSLH